MKYKRILQYLVQWIMENLHVQDLFHIFCIAPHAFASRTSQNAANIF